MMTAIAHARDTSQGHRTRRTRLFQPSSIAECPNWRYLIAHHLAHEADDQFPEHPDPWINDTAELLYVGLHKVPDFTGTWRQRYIRDTLRLWQQGGLVVNVLECFLAGGFSLDEIVIRCSVERGPLEAYAAVLCDVGDDLRRRGWAGLRLNPISGGRGQVGAIATCLQSNFFFGAAECVAGVVDALCRVEGPTLADGLPPQGTLEFLREFGLRGGFARALLTRSKKNCQLMQQFEEAQSGVTPGMPMNPAAIDVGLQILRRVKITSALQKEIANLREFCRTGPQAAMHVDG